MKLNLGRDSKARFGQDFEFQVYWKCWCLAEKLMLSRDSEDEMWSRFVFELVIWSYFGKMNSTLGSVVPLAMHCNVCYSNQGVSIVVLYVLVNNKLNLAVLGLMVSSTGRWLIEMIQMSCILMAGSQMQPTSPHRLRQVSINPLSGAVWALPVPMSVLALKMSVPSQYSSPARCLGILREE